MIAGVGSGYGPELTDIGSKRNVAYLRESVVSPNASVPENFMLVEAVTADGLTIRGIRMNEDSFTIQIKDSKSAFHSFRKADLRELRKLRNKSLMPSYQADFSDDELTDLTAYLAGLRGKQ